MFNKRLELLQKKNNLTVKQLSAELKIPLDYLEKLLSGSTEPTIDDISRLSDYFEVSTDYLLGKTTYSPSLAKTIGWKDYIQLHIQGKLSNLEYIPNTDIIPPKYALDSDFLPYSTNRKYGYGKKFNRYLVENDFYFFHKKDCISLNNRNTELIHKYIAIQDFSPCPICHPQDCIETWYVNFLKQNFKFNLNDSHIKLRAQKSQNASSTVVTK